MFCPSPRSRAAAVGTPTHTSHCTDVAAGTNVFSFEYCMYWVSPRRAADDALHMRDDVFNLAAFRSLGSGARPDGIPLSKLKAPGQLSFETTLSRATGRRAPKPYVSPMKAQGRTTTQSAAKAHKPAPPTTTHPATVQTSLGRPTTTSVFR